MVNSTEPCPLLVKTSVNAPQISTHAAMTRGDPAEIGYEVAVASGIGGPIQRVEIRLG